MIPKIEPTAAPIRVFKEARRILRSKKMMQIAMMAPTPAEIQDAQLGAIWEMLDEVVDFDNEVQP